MPKRKKPRKLKPANGQLIALYRVCEDGVLKERVGLVDRVGPRMEREDWPVDSKRGTHGN